MSDRSADAVLGWSRLAEQPLRAFLAAEMSRPYGTGLNLLAEPVFEATFGWRTADVRLSDLAPEIVHPDLIEALDSPPEALRGDYRFPPSLKPYAHQLEAWRVLSAPEPRSAIITSGTGSGKTECFLIPILSRLYAERARAPTRLTGVRALFLYPLNALINSQRDRLRAWTHRARDGVRFCLYNGLTPTSVRQDAQQPLNEVPDRKGLWASPPPILVTNPTMLEYMLVRNQDAPILDASRGKLEWIVLDEAHTYIGSQAAEIALLLRRVMHSFEVDPGSVRFVATSATIGDPHGPMGVELQQFLAALAGIDADQVSVIAGRRNLPSLPRVESSVQASLDDLMAIDPERAKSDERYAALTGAPPARAVRAAFDTENGGAPALTLSKIAALLDTCGAEGDRALEWLDLLSGTAHSADGSFLPLRVHLFHNVVPCLTACADRECPARVGTPLDTPQWPFGKVYMGNRLRCECGAPAYELRSCNECDASALWAHLETRDGVTRVVPAAQATVDEFALEIDPDGDETDEDDTPIMPRTQSSVVFTAPDSAHAEAVTMGRESMVLDPPDTEPTLRVWLLEGDASDVPPACPCCGYTAPRHMDTWRTARAGAPFLLGNILPKVLEYCPDGDKPLEKPYRGRRALSFTDSRQGTARIAIKLQQDAERNRVRALSYAYLHRAPPGREEDIAQRQRTIEKLERLAPDNKDLQHLLERERAALARLRAGPTLALKGLAEKLASNEPDLRFMQDHYQSLDPDAFGGDRGRHDVAGMLLGHEFIRRPKRMNNLETMGLARVHYPPLAEIGLPSGIRLDMGAEDWRDFLKIALDYFVRQSGAVETPDHWRRWGGQRVPNVNILPPRSEEKAGSMFRHWPRVFGGDRRQHRLVELLCIAFDLDPEDQRHRDIIGEVLELAWHALLRAGLLAPRGGGYALPLSAFHVTGLREAWVCPITHRFIDTTFRGYSPFATRATLAKGRQASCGTRVTLPICPHVGESFVSERERLTTIRSWLNTDPSVQSLREAGLWANLHDVTVEGAAYFRTAEHSAQQPAHRLRRYEALFKDGRINLLSCSTTMEMGVDIGGVSTVSMNNLPPHPANYLQRTGRAGRRGEARSHAVTLCRDNPLDQQVFGDPMWPFRTRIKAPVVSLSSAVVVQRHVNAMLLADFLRYKLESQTSGDMTRLTCGWFFGGDQAPVGEMLRRLDSQLPSESLAAGLRQVTRGSVLAGASPETMADGCSQELQRVWESWLGERNALEHELRNTGSTGEDNKAARRGIEIRLARLDGEYLLTWLVSRAVLPTHGFPTGIVSFDTINREAVLAESRHRDDDFRDDMPTRRRDLANRDAATALREYAPGSDVVMDGKVYKSGGITLNWHIPADQTDVREIQDIRHVWQCARCGASGDQPTRPEHCSDCGAEIKASRCFEILLPAGFAVDFFAPTHDDITRPAYVAPNQPIVHGGGTWVMLANPELGRYRSTPHGSVVHYSSGAGGEGYAICLVCGRAAPMSQTDVPGAATLPAEFQVPHTRLRGGGKEADRICPGSHDTWKIKPGLRLGHPATTDVFELQLNDEHGMPLRDRTAAMTIAVACRNAAAQLLGIESDELGFHVKEVANENGDPMHTVLLFDLHAAGHASALDERVTELLNAAARQLDCVANCDSVCEHCLLAYDTRFRADELNRFAAAGVLNAQWLSRLHLPAAERHFGDGSEAEPENLVQAIERQWAKAESLELDLYVHGSPVEWDLASEAFRARVYDWAQRGKAVHIYVPPAARSALTPEVAATLFGFASHPSIAVHAADSPAETGSAVLLAAISSVRERTGWATRDVASGVPGPGWLTSDAVIVRGPAPRPAGSPITSDQLRALFQIQAGATVAEIEITEQLNGTTRQFGEKLWGLIFEACQAARAFVTDSRRPITSIEYDDRYLRSPLTVALLAECVHALKSHVEESWQVERVRVCTGSSRQDVARRPEALYDDWNDEATRHEVIERLFEECGLAAQARSAENRDLEHARCLRVRNAEGGELRIRFDQGFGYWRVRASQRRFDFAAAPRYQAVELATLDVGLVGRAVPTYVFVSVVDPG